MNKTQFPHSIVPERLPPTTQLLANYPNPFNPETWIPFQLSQNAEVRLTIYDVAGRTVREIYWDGQTGIFRHLLLSTSG
ncbi:MAG: T9SS type A sorting domain-containing protein [Candidatus Poribacteria bacterium]|nr:T9SS type A sorting domain-containing protein [Candidatus Poribacteria bacterium]MDP6752000.1 T9SS type A sorting domain-containing protein [Candidatus Poribacteria bacterium]